MTIKMTRRETESASGKGLHSFFAVSVAVLFWSLAFGSGGSTALAAPASASLLKAKADAEAKGYIFETSHDEIVAKAKKEAGFVC